MLGKHAGWGFIALLLFAFLHRLVFRAVLLIPDRVGLAAAFLLVCAYAVDFAVSAYQAYQNAHTSTEAEHVPGRAGPLKKRGADLYTKGIF